MLETNDVYDEVASASEWTNVAAGKVSCSSSTTAPLTSPRRARPGPGLCKVEIASESETPLDRVDITVTPDDATAPGKGRFGTAAASGAEPLYPVDIDFLELSANPPSAGL